MLLLLKPQAVALRPVNLVASSRDFVVQSLSLFACVEKVWEAPARLFIKLSPKGFLRGKRAYLWLQIPNPA